MRDFTDQITLSTIGLVACGGKSSRMKTDKSKLIYHQKPQCYHLVDMLRSICSDVLLSVNQNQSAFIHTSYDYITDDSLYSEAGPMTALLSGFSAFPNRHILLIGCDYPLLTMDELKQFLHKIKGETPNAFFNESTGFYEPLLAWYPSIAFEKLKSDYMEGQYSLQQFLRQSNAEKYIPQNNNSLLSANTPEASENIRSIIANSPDQCRTFGS